MDLLIVCETCGLTLIQASKSSFSQEDIDAYRSVKCAVDGTTNLQITLDGTTVSFTPKVSPPLLSVVQGQLAGAQDFGNSIILQFAAENYLGGYSTTDLNTVLTTLTGVMQALQTGSITIALQRLEALEPDGQIITVARLTEYRNILQAYLGMPLT